VVAALLVSVPRSIVAVWKAAPLPAPRPSRKKAVMAAPPRRRRTDSRTKRRIISKSNPKESNSYAAKPRCSRGQCHSREYSTMPPRAHFEHHATCTLGRYPMVQFLQSPRDNYRPRFPTLRHNFGLLEETGAGTVDARLANNST